MTYDKKRALFERNFFRFTGPPENWLTAIKYMTWGLEEKYHDRWKQIQVGDVFLMHSMAKSQYVKNPASAIVGLGVVGGQFRMKQDFLWVQEIQEQTNRWPLLVPFSEVYLFSTMPAVSWEAPGIATQEATSHLVAALLKDAVPLRDLTDQPFPVMGSWSSVRKETVSAVFGAGEPVLYREFYATEKPSEEPADFSIIRDAASSVRSVPSLKFLDGSMVRARRPTYGTSEFERDNALLERAEESHADVLQQAIDLFKKRGFDTWHNHHVDLLAESEDRAFLVEVKSTVNHNFRSQARNAVGQLFEYEHFDVRRYFERKSKSVGVSKVLMITSDPVDEQYPSFLNSLKIYLAWPSSGTRISVRGDTGPLSSLMASN